MNNKWIDLLRKKKSETSQQPIVNFKPIIKFVYKIEHIKILLIQDVLTKKE
jgi:hypothetical protein